MVTIDSHASSRATPLQALWFDGCSSRRQLVELQATDSELLLHGEQGPRRYPLGALRVAEDLPATPLPVGLPDGGTLWLDDAAQPLRQALLRRERPRQRVARLTASWPAALACVVALVLLLVWFDRQGAALLGDAAVRLMPRAVDRIVGERAQQLMGKGWLHPSHLPAQRQQAITERFNAISARLAPDIRVDLRFRRVSSEKGYEAGFNAFALPDGTVFVLDGLCEAMTDDELMFVLGHELGHVVHRHALRATARTLTLFSVAGVVFGDFSSLLANGVAGVQTLSFSRDAEREADAYAIELVRRAGLPPDTAAGAWRAFAREEQRRNITGVPMWLSTHPPTEERLRQAQGR